MKRSSNKFRRRWLTFFVFPILKLMKRLDVVEFNSHVGTIVRALFEGPGVHQFQTFERPDFLSPGLGLPAVRHART
jgi:hypothetical protein